MVRDADADKDLARAFSELIADDDKMKTLAENVGKMALRNAVDKIVEKVEELIKK